MSGVFGGQLSKLKQKTTTPPEVPVHTDPDPGHIEQTSSPMATITSKRKPGKVSNPDYKVRGVLIHQPLQRQVEDRWRREGHKSEQLADMVEHALRFWVNS